MISPRYNSRRRFYPVHSLDGKNNCKPFHRIEPDGSVTERVFLNVPDSRLREEIVLVHFLRSYVRWIYQELVDIRVLARDAPWDFLIEMNTGDRFNIEVVSIADSIQLHMNNKREEALDKVASSKTIPLSRLKKLNSYFPNAETSNAIIKMEETGIDKNAEVENPWYNPTKRIIASYLPPPDGSLFELIESALASKTAKLHSGMENTILIIDNRTSAYDIEDFRKAEQRFDELRVRNPFREVWFYTGYYSDDDGNNAEWSLVPILVTSEIMNKLESGMKRDGLEPNEDGIVFGKMGDA